MEQFNKEFPNGDSFELAKFMFAKGYGKGRENGYLAAALAANILLL